MFFLEENICEAISASGNLSENQAFSCRCRFPRSARLRPSVISTRVEMFYSRVSSIKFSAPLGQGLSPCLFCPPGAAMVPVSEKGKCLYRECLRCTSAFSPWEEGRSQQGPVSVPTTAGGRSGSGPPLGLCPGCSLCLDDCLPPPGPFLNVTCSKHPSLTL